MTETSRLRGFDPEFDGVYAAIATAIRCTREAQPGPRVTSRMTKARVAAIHRKVLAGEALEGDQERDIAGRLRQQLGVPEGPRDGAGPVRPGELAE